MTHEEIVDRLELLAHEPTAGMASVITGSGTLRFAHGDRAALKELERQDAEQERAFLAALDEMGVEVIHD